MKVARAVLSGGKDGDNFKVLPIATQVKANRNLKENQMYKSKITIPIKRGYLRICIYALYRYR
ncbi:hypothetical protein COD14_06995 [Bacillus cereus]|nr:hypothetical protein COD14_06995 [Bacillus cereus]